MDYYDFHLLTHAVQHVEHFVLIGGYARSGTTKVANLVHSIAEVFCFDECHSLKSALPTRCFLTATNYLQSERMMWHDAEGRSHRGLTEADEIRRRKFLFVSLLTAYNRKNSFVNKPISGIQCIACKTPSLEFQLATLLQSDLGAKFSYVHCVRNPISCLVSNWQMPWVTQTDPHQFISSFCADLEASFHAYSHLKHFGIPLHVVRLEDIVSPSSIATQQLAKFIGYSAIPHANDVVDDWPKNRRRQVSLDIEEFAHSVYEDHRIQAWCQEFGYALPAEQSKAA